MNTPNNKRRRDSQQRMEKAFIQMLQSKELEEISVTDICREAGVNRTTFYSNYVDLYGLAEAIRQQLMQEVLGLYQDREKRNFDNGFLVLFRHIRENQLFYKTYFKLSKDEDVLLMGYSIEKAEEYYGNHHIEYHIEFFRSGFNAIIKKWLRNGCRETPEEMADILVAEYMPKSGRQVREN